MKKSLKKLLIGLLTLSIGVSTFAMTPAAKSETELPAASTVNITLQNTLGIIGAMEEEVEILKEKMNISQVVTEAGMTFYHGTLHGQDIVLARSGVGKVNAAVCAQLMISLFDIDYLINSGVAGTLNKDIDQGDIVISTDAVQHDFDVTALGDPLGEISRLGITYFEADDNLISVAEKAAANVNLEGVETFRGRVASGDQFIAGGPVQERIQEHFAPSAVEMEGAAIAHVAYLNDIPYVIIRSISDKADGHADLSYEEFLPIAARNASLLLEEIVKLSSTLLPVDGPTVDIQSAQ
ncbi:MAG: 5'-methylthioadenosine/adenosylhomocysteine nucleosidase [Cellulosilyticaceae bacterium]